MRCVRLFRLLCCATAVVANPLISLGASAQTPPMPPPAPINLSQYDCAALTDPAVSVMHIGQVVQNVYTEWQQFTRVRDGARMTVCIGLMRPTAKTLSQTEAADLL